MNRPVITIKDVARQAGLSVTTVSRALNNYDDVAATTRDRVQEIARALDYHPNMAARSLQMSHANALGLVIPLVLHRSYDAYWLEFIGGVAAACARQGVDLLVSTADAVSDALDGIGPGLQRIVRGRRVDGLLICDVRQVDPRIGYLQRQHLPFVAFGRTVGTHDYPFIDVDGTAGMTQAMDHLLRLGHRRIAYLGVSMVFGFSHFRFIGYQESLTHAGIPYDAELIYHDLDEEAVSAVLACLCRLPVPPTAVVVSADFLSLALLKAARVAGLRLPDDLSVVVFDDSLLLQHADPPLTAVSQPNRRLGEDAATILLQRVAQPDGPLVQRLVIPGLAIRASTVRPRVAV